MAIEPLLTRSLNSYSVKPQSPAASMVAADSVPEQSMESIGGNNLPARLAGVRLEADASPEQAQLAVQKLNEFIQKLQRDIHFDLDQQTGKTVITVRDRQTQEVIRQIPPEYVIKMAKMLQDEISARQGQLVQTSA